MLLLIFLPIVLLVLPRAALAFNEPNGFGKARLGMTVDAVKKAFPALKEHVSNSAEASALMAVYSLDKQTVFGLKGCTVDFYFNPSKLYQISFNCGNGVNVVTTLNKRFGDPSQLPPGSAMWQGEHTVITLNTKSRIFAFVDRSLNQDMQARLMQYMLAHQAKPGTATPAPAPTPAAPQ